MKLETILDKAKYLIKKSGIKVLVLDPFNKIEHQRNRNESETEYISRALDMLINFARKNSILVILVAHPRKMQKNGGVFEIPTLYDINGSANFYNKADYGITVYRNNNEGTSEIHIQKVKFNHWGQGGTATMKYETISGRFVAWDSETEQKSYLFANTEDPLNTSGDFYDYNPNNDPIPF
jgi:twinkle protein